MAATLAELDTITGDDKMCHWQFIKAVIEYRYGDLPKAEAIDTISFYTGLDPFFAEIMLKEMSRERLKTLLLSFPEIGPPPPVRILWSDKVRGASRGS